MLTKHKTLLRLIPFLSYLLDHNSFVLAIITLTFDKGGPKTIDFLGIPRPVHKLSLELIFYVLQLLLNDCTHTHLGLKLCFFFSFYCLLRLAVKAILKQI